MKNIIGIFLVMLAFTANSSMVQSSKVSTIKFKTSAICGQCKERIEEKLNYTKGVIYAELDLETKILSVKFRTDLISAEKVKEVLANIGYSSDTVIRNREAYLALPKCCRGEENCEPHK